MAAAATAAAAAAADQETALQVEEVISLLLALGFFRVQAPDFVNAALQALGAAGEQLCDLNPVQLSRLWKALLLLQDDGVTLPEDLVQVWVGGGGGTGLVVPWGSVLGGALGRGMGVREWVPGGTLLLLQLLRLWKALLLLQDDGVALAEELVRVSIFV